MPHLITAAAGRLTAALTELKEKVREALAGETAKAVGEAVRQAVAAALTRRSPDADPDPPDPHADPRGRWHDPADRWDRGDWDRGDWDRGDWDADDRPPPPLPPPDPAAGVADRTRLAVAAGVAAGRWWLARGGVVAAVAVGGLVALAVLFGGPATHAAARALTAAADLAAVGRALRPPDDDE